MNGSGLQGLLAGLSLAVFGQSDTATRTFADMEPLPSLPVPISFIHHVARERSEFWVGFALTCIHIYIYVYTQTYTYILYIYICTHAHPWLSSPNTHAREGGTKAASTPSNMTYPHQRHIHKPEEAWAGS